MYRVVMLFIDNGDFEDFIHVAYCNSLEEAAKTINCTVDQARDILDGYPDPEYDIYRILELDVGV